MFEQLLEQEIACSWADGETRQHLGQMVFTGSKAIEVNQVLERKTLDVWELLRRSAFQKSLFRSDKSKGLLETV